MLRQQPDCADIVIIFQNAPNQSSAFVIGQKIHQVGFDEVCAIEPNGELLELCPERTGNDTIRIPSYAGYSEIMIQYQGIEWDYFLLKGGDTVLVSYNEMFRPVLSSKTSSANTRLYNLQFLDSRAIHSNGYSSSCILSSGIFQGWHRYYTDSSSQKRFPELKEKFDKVHVDLDSLGVVYSDYFEDFNGVVDSLDFSGDKVYADYYRRMVLGKNDYTPKDVIINDSLMHYIRNYRKALEYPQGETSPEKFDYMLGDTIATPLAKRMILKNLLNWIKNSEYWGEGYPDALIEKYECLYLAETGDSTMVHENVSTPNVSDNGGYSYDLVLEDIKGEKTTLDELVKSNIGNVIFIDLWASWCGPCRGEMPEAKEIRKSFVNDNVFFVYISTDTDAAAWKKAVKDCDTGSYGGRNYRLLNGDGALFMKQIKARYIPQYVVINKEGKVIDIAAPRPSSGDLEGTQKALL